MEVLRALLDRVAVERPAVAAVMLYSGLGLLQVCWRLLTASLAARRMRGMLSTVPRGGFKDGLLGSIPELAANIHRLHDWRQEMMAGFRVCQFSNLSVDPHGIGLAVTDPACIRHFLKDSFDKYTKPPDSEDFVFMYMREWLGEGIFTIRHGSFSEDQGRSWTLQRKIAANIFTRGNFNNFMQEVFHTKSQRLCEELAKRANSSQPVDMQCQFFNFTMDSIMCIFFGEESDTLGGEPHKYGEAYDLAHHNFFDYCMRAMGFVSITRLLLPWPFGGHNGLAWRLHAALSTECRRFRAACRVLDQESDRLINACRADPALAARRDLLALFVQAEDKQNFSHKFLRDVVLNFVIAGRDTTACLLSWMFYALAQNPEVQQRLCAEIDEKAPASLTFKSVGYSELPYLHGVIYETLRLWPPVPFDVKAASDDDVWPNGVRVPRGCKVMFLPYAMGRDGSRWPEPLAFRPERWIPFSQPPHHEFPVFQAGPRICLGMDMAIFEAKVVACNLLRQFQFELLPGEAEKITYTLKLTMNISNSHGRPHGSEELKMLVRSRLKA